MAAAATAAGLSLRGWLALLPVRVDDRRFWTRAAVALALRWAALQAEWASLREALTAGVFAATSELSSALTVVSSTRLAMGSTSFDVGVGCTHVEVLALVAPLAWDRSKCPLRNATWLALLALVIALFAWARVTLAIGAYSVGVPWAVAHDLPLGVGYFALLAFVLARGAWTRDPLRARKVSAPPAAAGAERPQVEGSA